MSRFYFFFSSRRRHTRLQGDWSSDVCSSDLRRSAGRRARWRVRLACCHPRLRSDGGAWRNRVLAVRSEERRVGKECRSGGSTEQSKKKEARRRWDEHNRG